MLTRQDIEDMGYEYYSPNTSEKAKAFCMTPMDMVQEFAKVTGQVPKPGLYLTLIKEEYEEFSEVALSGPLSKEGDLAELKELSDLVYVTFGYANAMGWDLMEAVRRVHMNNLGRCVQPDGSIKRREDGKIIKNPDAPKVDLSDLV